MDYIVDICQKNGIDTPSLSLNVFDYRSLEGVYDLDRIEELNKIARKRGGKCLSEVYINSISNLKWRCKEGHEWEATPGAIKYRTWCPICSVIEQHNKFKLGIEKMKEIAKSREGECLSEEYINSHTKLKWKCKEGHEWEASSSNIKNLKTWCPYCAGHGPLTIGQMKEIAQERGGECLSEFYINSETKLKWKCKEGHEWKAVPSSIRKGHWCPICAGRVKLTIDDMRITAKIKEGECFSKEYQGSHVKLRWRCKEGHIWEATPGNIRAGKWCPICARSKKKKDRIKTIN